MSQYEFPCSADAQRFCGAIVTEMMAKFSIAQDEAVGRLNRQWRRYPFVADDDIRWHEDACFWANQIYYQDSVKWWVPGAELRAKPYP